MTASLGAQRLLPVMPPAGLPEPTAAADPRKLWKAAREFEAMAIGALLQPMFDTIDSGKSPLGGGPGEAAFKPMLVQEMAKKIAAGGGFGLAAPVYAQMLRMQEAKGG